MDDAQIIGLYWERSEQALCETQSKYDKYLFSVAYNILSDRDDSRECTNDTYYKAWVSMPPNRPDSLKYYLAKITRNIAVNIFQRQHAEKRGGSNAAVVFDELDECVADENAFDKFTEMEFAEIIDSFLAVLTKEKRVIFVKRYWYAESVNDIAEEMNRSVGSVKMSLMRLKKEFKEYLAARMTDNE
jgi:RNA polymerase sigma factor (sigma-70 family)